MSVLVFTGAGRMAMALGAALCLVVGDRPLLPALERCLALIPAAVIAAIVAKDTLSVGQHLQIDARLAG